jgi:hypothetical protein
MPTSSEVPWFHVIEHMYVQYSLVTSTYQNEVTITEKSQPDEQAGYLLVLASELRQYPRNHVLFPWMNMKMNTTGGGECQRVYPHVYSILQHVLVHSTVRLNHVSIDFL